MSCTYKYTTQQLIKSLSGNARMVDNRQKISVLQNNDKIEKGNMGDNNKPKICLQLTWKLSTGKVSESNYERLAKKG